MRQSGNPAAGLLGYLERRRACQAAAGKQNRMVVPNGGQTESENAQRRAWLREISLGSRATFTRLYHSFYGPLLRFIYRHVGNEQLAEELVNDTMFIVWEKAGEFRGESKVSTWIMGIAAHLCMNARRRVNVPTQSIDASSEILIEPSFVPGLELRESLTLAIAGLSHDHRAVLELSYVQGFSCDEIAEIEACPVSTVKTRLHYARKHLRVMLDEKPCLATPTSSNSSS
jgi:RNA polymerase sigma-70 factor, ECF subfamily